MSQDPKTPSMTQKNRSPTVVRMVERLSMQRKLFARKRVYHKPTPQPVRKILPNENNKENNKDSTVKYSTVKYSTVKYSTVKDSVVKDSIVSNHTSEMHSNNPRSPMMEKRDYYSVFANDNSWNVMWSGTSTSSSTSQHANNSNIHKFQKCICPLQVTKASEYSDDDIDVLN